MFAEKQYLKFLPVLLCLALFTSCSLFGGDSTRHPVKAPNDKQIYNVPEIGIDDFDTLDPARAHDNASLSAIQMIFTGLIQANDHLQPQAQLAQSWEVAGDGVTWTFHLRPHLTFSDGTPLTSADVAYSIDRALQPTAQSTTAPLYLSVLKDTDQLFAGRVSTLINDSILTPNADTVVLITKQKAPYFLSQLTAPCSYVVEKSLVSRYGAKFVDHLDQGGGAGPFKVTQYTPRVAIHFAPNPNYYNAKPQLQKVNFLFYPSAAQAYQDYQAGKIDMAEIPLAIVDNLRKRPDLLQVPQAWINYYTMNYLVKPFDNIHVRQAFALAIDKASITRNIWKNTAIPTNHILPQGIASYNPHLTSPDGSQSLTGNAARAQLLLKQGLQEEGWSSATQMPAITLTYSNSAPNGEQEVAALITAWKNVLHMTVTPQALDYNTLLDKVTASVNNGNGLQLWGLSWVGQYADPHEWLTQQFGKGAVYNAMNYGENMGHTATQQQTTQQQLETADATMDANARIQLYQQAEQQLVNDVAWIPLEQMTATFLRSSAIIGIVDNAQGVIPADDWARIYRVQ